MARIFRYGRRRRLGFRRALLLGALLIALVAAPARAQLPQTRLSSIFPCGGKAGTTVDFTLTGGVDLDEVDRLLFNHAGITATPKTQKVAGRDQPIANAFRVAIRPDVPPGVYEVYAGGLFGLSNPRVFVVGNQNEQIEAEPNNDLQKPNDIRLNQIVNGVLASATDVDVFRFQGKKGQRIVATCRASDLDSRLSAAIELLSADGRRFAHAREEIRHDPVVDVVLPVDGAYLLKVHDFMFRNGSEYTYRLSVGTGPYIDYIMPPAGVPGTTATFTLYGRNLPGGKPAGAMVGGRPLEKLDVAIAIPGSLSMAQQYTLPRSTSAGIESFSYVLRTPAGDSNPVVIEAVSSLPVLEKEPNGSPATAQKIRVPCEFAGQFQAVGDTDYVTFTAKAGDIYYVDVFADRLGSIADPYLVLDQVVRDAKGKESTTRITAMDDDNSNIAPNIFDTRSDDPTYRFQVPADGTYRIELRDQAFESRGDPRLVYRLSIRTEHPDFRFVALPRYPVQGTVAGVSAWGMGLRRGDSRDVEILTIRQDGFDAPIQIWAEGLPPGVSCKSITVGRNLKSTSLIFTAEEKAPEWSGLIRILGKSPVADPAKKGPLAAADAELKRATESVDKAAALASKTSEAFHKAEEFLTIAKQVPLGQAKEDSAAKAATDAQSAVDAIAKANQSATQSLAAAKKRLVGAQSSQRAAADAAAPKETVREAIAGAIVWNAAANISAISRVGQSLALSVMKEPAPLQICAGLDHIDANQGRQILIPVSLVKRGGFDADVPLKIAGLPDGSNVDIQMKPIPKGKNDELVRVFVKPDARVGVYALYWTSQAAVAYRRNPFALDRAKAEQAAARAAAAQAAETAKKAIADRDRAARKLGEAIAARKAEAANRTSAEAELAAARLVLKGAIEQSARPNPAVVESFALAQSAADVAAFVRKSAEESAAAARSVTSPTKAAAQSKMAAAAKAVAQSQKVANEAAASSVKLANAAKALREKRLAAAHAALERAEHDAARSGTSESDAETEFKIAKMTQSKTEALVKPAQAKSVEATAAKTAADQKVDQATKASAPQNLNDFVLSTPVMLTIKHSPLQVNATVPNGGTLKKGGKLEVKVRIQRRRGFKGPVAIGLPLPPGIAGIVGSPLTIPADKREGLLSIAATTAATPGDVANLVVRAAADFEGKAEVDAPINLKIVP